MPDSSLLERALGAYLGLAAGDALGATVEFMTAGEIAATHRVHRDIIGGGWLRLRPGQVTDDTEMSLALGDAIVAAEGWSTRKAADAFVGWLRGRPVDIGNTCRRGLRRYMTEGTLEGPPCESEAGNGAAMRNLPVVLANLWDSEALRERSLAQARITHMNPLSDAGTLGLAELTAVLLRGGDLPAAVRSARAFVEAYPVFRYKPWPGRTSGYVVDTVQTVLEAFFETDNLEDCVVRAVGRGGDADTIGALAGQLAGAHYGLRAIPVRWLRRLEEPVLERIRNQVPRLLALAGRARGAPAPVAPPAPARRPLYFHGPGEPLSRHGREG